MIIEVVEGFRLKSDTYCWAIERKVLRKSSSTDEKYEDWEPMGYTGNLDSAALLLMRKLLMISDDTLDLKETTTKLEDFAHQVNSILGEAKKSPEVRGLPGFKTQETMPKREPVAEPESPAKPQRKPRKIR